MPSFGCWGPAYTCPVVINKYEVLLQKVWLIHTKYLGAYKQGGSQKDPSCLHWNKRNGSKKFLNSKIRLVGKGLSIILWASLFCGLQFLKLLVTYLWGRVKGLVFKTSADVVHKQAMGFGPEAAHDATNGLTYIDIVKRYIGDTAYAGIPLHSASEYPQDSVKVCAKSAEYFSCVL